MTQLDKPRLLARLARVVASADGRDPLEVRLCRAYLGMLGGEGAALTLAYTRPERVTLCATDETAARLEDLQDVLGEGPGPDAYRTGAIAVADLNRAELPWPLFADAARKAAGPVLLYAVPMRPGQDVLGVLTVYQHAPVVPPPDEALFLSDAIGAALLREPIASESELRSGPWSTRAGIHQATGMVTAQLQVSPADALALLRAHAYAHETSLEEVAERVVERGLSFFPDDDGESEEP